VDPRGPACADLQAKHKNGPDHGYLTPKAEIERRMQRRMSPEETNPFQPASLTQEGGTNRELHEAKHYS